MIGKFLVTFRFGEMWDDSMNEAHAKWTLCNDSKLKIKLHVRSIMRYVNHAVSLLQATGLLGGMMPGGGEMSEEEMAQMQQMEQMQMQQMQQQQMQQQQPMPQHHPARHRV